jgi:hypothetical protein
MARLPLQLRPFGAAATLAMPLGQLFPAALDLEDLTPQAWAALLSWFQPRQREQPASRSGPGGRPGRRRRGESPGQLSLELGLDAGPA